MSPIPRTRVEIGKEIRPLEKLTRDKTVEDRMVDAKIIKRGEVIRDPRLTTLLLLLKDLPLPHEYDFTTFKTLVMKGMTLLDFLQSYVDENVFLYLDSTTDNALIAAAVDIVFMRDNALSPSGKDFVDRKVLTHACQQQIKRMQIVKTLLMKTTIEDAILDQPFHID